MSIDPADVCAIGADGYATLDAALDAATTGQTITVLRSFTHTSPVVIDDKDLTLDLSEGSITIDTSGDVNNNALTVRRATVTLTGGGYLDIRGSGIGVYADNGTVTVRYAAGITAAYAINGGKITVQGDATGSQIGALAYGAGSSVTVNDDAIATGLSGRAAYALVDGQITAKNALATGANSTGAEAVTQGTVTITRRAEGTMYGAYAHNSAHITVGGDVTADGGGGIGAWADTGGRITVGGDVFGQTEYYVKVGTLSKHKTEWADETTLAGYRTYSDGTSTVWVKEGVPAPVDVCAIGGTEFATLDDALAQVDGTAEAPTVIRLLQSIDYPTTLDVGGRHVVFDLNGFNLTVNGAGQIGLVVAGGSVGYTGQGAFVITGSERVVEASAGGRAAVTGVRIADDYTIGAYAGGDNSRVTVNGDIRTNAEFQNAIGAYASGTGAHVVANGAIWIEGSNAYGATAGAGGRVTVQVGSGDVITVTGEFAVGVNPRYGSEVIVSTGDIAVIGASSTGVLADGGTARVGSVSASGAYSTGVRSLDYGDVTVNGDVSVTGADALGIDAQVGEGAGGSVYVTGSVSVTGEDSRGVDADSRSESTSHKSLVTIDGQLSAPQYLTVDDISRTIDSKDGTDAYGYWLYTGRYGSLVQIKNGQPALGLPVVVTNAVTGITSTGAQLAGEVSSDGGAAVSERGFVYSTAPEPTLAGGAKIPAGSGTGDYQAVLSGLRAGTTYYVRAYATNSEGTSYGGNESFVTQSSPTPTPTPTPDPAPDSVTPDPDPPNSSDPASPGPGEDLDELATTGGPGEGQILWLLGIMSAAVVSGLLILMLKDRVLRRR